MTIGWQTIQCEGKDMRVYMGVPERQGRLPAVVVAQHGTGVDAQMQDVVHQLYKEGYVAAAPEFFHRQPDYMKQTPGAIGKVAYEDKGILADINATIAHLKTLPCKVAPIGIVGFCMGGRFSYLAATAIKELKCAVMFYGAGIMKAAPDGPTPFERTADIQCPILSLSGTEDINSTVEQMKTIQAELTRLKKWNEFHFYQDAPHSFLNFADPRYRARPARAAWGKMLAFLEEHMKGGAPA
jgi:carboxymethylenebutenolidase